MPGRDDSTSTAESFKAMDKEATETLGDEPIDKVSETCPKKKDTLMIRIAIKNEEGQPVPEVPYRLKVGDEEWNEKTDSRGLVEQEVPADSTEGLLEVWRDGDQEKDPEEIRLELAQMDPLGMETGQKARLHNLGFSGFDDDDEPESSLDEALFYFRLWAGLPDGDTVDKEAQQLLGALYDPLTTEEPFDPFDDPEKPIEAEEDEGPELEPPSG